MVSFADPARAGPTPAHNPATIISAIAHVFASIRHDPSQRACPSPSRVRPSVGSFAKRLAGLPFPSENETMRVNLTVNGQRRADEVEQRMLLVDYLREVAQLTGTHVGCETWMCGACTVLVNGKAAKSCTILTVQAEGAEITSVEGLAKDGKLHPVQEGFWEEHGLQCGYCTPGMIMMAADLLSRNANPSEDEIRTALEGNLCRRTGYQHIVKAVQYDAAKMRAKAA